MRRMTVWAIAAVLLCVTGLSAQGKTDFSGKWTNTTPAPAPDANAFCGQECTIAQDAATLTVTRTTEAGERKTTVKLDGSESKNAGRSGTELVSKAMWDGAKLIITMKLLKYG